MKEISRRVTCNVDEGGVACGPCGGTIAFDAEIVVEDEGQDVYLHGQWISEAGDHIRFEATKESVYDVYVALNQCDFRDEERFNSIIAERDRIYEGTIEENGKYEEYYKELEEMIIEARKESGYWDDEDE